MMSSPHNFPLILFTEMTKIPYFSYEKVKLALYTLRINAEQCLLSYILILGHVFMLEQKEINIFKMLYTNTWKLGGVDIINSLISISYRLFKKCFIENYENQKFHIFLIFYPIYIKFSLLCLKTFSLSIELT